MDADDDNEYMNAAAAHAAIVMSVSAASMYRLLRHAQHAHDINIHKLHPLPEKSAWAALPNFCTVEPVTLFHADFNRDFNHDFSHDFLHIGTPLLRSLPHAVIKQWHGVGSANRAFNSTIAM